MSGPPDQPKAPGSAGGYLLGKADLEAKFSDLLTRLQPTPDYMRLFNAVVLDAWKEQQQQSREACTRLEQRLAGLRQRLDDLDEAFIYRRVVDQQTYERQRDRLREQAALVEADLEDAKVEELDVEGVLAFAQHVLTDAARLWEQAAPEQKRRLQAALFPQGLSFDGVGFGTPVTSLAFGLSATSAGAERGLASPTGFEAIQRDM